MAAPGLILIVQTRAIDRVCYALMLAASNAALDGPTRLFFAVEGVEALRPDAWRRLNTAAGESGAAFLQRLHDAGAAGPDDLLEALAALDVSISACDTALAMAGLSESDLRPDLNVTVTGLTAILSTAAADRVVYV